MPKSHSFYLIDGADSFGNFSSDILTIQHRDDTRRDISGADGLAGIVVGAVAESLLLHGADHVAGATLALRLTLGQETEMGDFGTDKEHG